MEVTAALLRLGGAARWDELMGLGVSEWAIRVARDTGAVVTPARGAYALPSADPAHLAAAALRGQISCVSACTRWKLRQLDPPEHLHIAVPGSRHIKDDRLRDLGLPGVHRGVAWSGDQRIVGVAEALDTSALCTTPLQQLVMVDAALEGRLIRPSALRQFRCGPQDRRAWLAKSANGGAMSVSETVARASLQAAGLRPRVQEPRPGVGAVDLAVGTRFLIEIDGFEEHSKWGQFTKDRRRDREVSAVRDWTLRYTYWDVVEDPRWFVYDVSRIVRIPVQKWFEARMVWLTTTPATALNRI